MSTGSPALIRLRGHHLLCVFGFRGLGYDKAFARAMADTVRTLRKPDTTVQIVAGLDDLCAHCPHRDKASCASNENARDRGVLTAIGLPIGHSEIAGTLFAAVAARISATTFTDLCASCDWFSLGYCAEGLQAGCVAYGWVDCEPATAVIGG